MVKLHWKSYSKTWISLWLGFAFQGMQLVAPCELTSHLLALLEFKILTSHNVNYWSKQFFKNINQNFGSQSAEGGKQKSARLLFYNKMVASAFIRDSVSYVRVIIKLFLTMPRLLDTRRPWSKPFTPHWLQHSRSSLMKILLRFGRLKFEWVAP